jgi:hypothetical protein
MGEHERRCGLTGGGPSRIIESDGVVREAAPLREPGSQELPIAGRVVCAVAVSRFVPFLSLQFWGNGVPDSAPGPDHVLQIEGPLRVIASERETRIVPEAGPDDAYLLLVNKTVARAFASNDGLLEVEFSDGDRLVVPPHEYEPWQLSGDDGSLFVSLAGGGLAIWSATRP